MLSIPRKVLRSESWQESADGGISAESPQPTAPLPLPAGLLPSAAQALPRGSTLRGLSPPGQTHGQGRTDA